MRNLLEYPISREEIVEMLEDYKVEAFNEMIIGDTRFTMLQMLIDYLNGDEMEHNKEYMECDLLELLSSSRSSE